MEWSKLDIRKVANLKKEVDISLVALNKLQNDIDTTKRDLLLTSMQGRIHQLEEFHALNDADERAILFEKQRLRLRKAVQVALHGVGPATTVTAAINTNAGSFQQSPEKSPALSMSALNIRSTPQVLRSSPPTSPATPQTDSPAQRIARRIERNPMREFAASGIRNRPEPEVKREAPPLYAWETDAGLKKGPKSRLNLDGMSYLPTQIPGLYTSDSSTNQDEEFSQKFIDFQMVLTADEMSSLISRRRITSREDIHIAKSEIVSSNVHIDTPFVDYNRLMKDYLRAPKKDKWVSKNDIRPSRK